MSLKDKEVIHQIEKLVDEVLEQYVAIKGISIGSEIALNIFTKFKPDLKIFSENEIIAGATSFHYICSSLFNHVMKNEMNSAFVTVEKYTLIMQIVKQVSSAMILDRKLAELEGIAQFQEVLHNLALNVNAIAETSPYLAKDPLTKIIRAVPSASFLAIINKEGLPIKVTSTTEIQAPMAASQIAALSNLTNFMLKNPMDYAILQGEKAYIMVFQFDEERILAIAVPDSEKAHLGTYLARIKEIIHNADTYSPIHPEWSL